MSRAPIDIDDPALNAAARLMLAEQLTFPKAVLKTIDDARRMLEEARSKVEALGRWPEISAEVARLAEIGEAHRKVMEYVQSPAGTLRFASMVLAEAAAGDGLEDAVKTSAGVRWEAIRPISAYVLDELRDEIVKLRAAVQPALQELPWIWPPEGPLPLDVAAAKYLAERFGSEAGAQLEASARQRWAVWTGEAEPEQADLFPDSSRDLFTFWLKRSEDGSGLRFVRYVAGLLINERLDQWKEKAGRLRSNTAAIVLPLFKTIGQSLRPARVSGGKIVDFDTGKPLPLVPMVPSELGSLEGSKGLEQLGSVTAQRLIRHMAIAAHRRVALGLPHPSRVEYAGWNGLAVEIGERSNKAQEILPAVAEVLQQTTLAWDSPASFGRVSLLAGFEYKRAHRSQASHLTLWLSPIFMPGQVHLIPEGSRDRVLTPVLPPPLVGTLNRTLHAAAFRLDWYASGELAELVRVVDLATDVLAGRGVPLDWPELADRAGLPRKHLPTLLDLWSTDRDGEPARWERLPGGRWWLADRPLTTDARAFLVQAAGTVVARSRRGKRRVEKKRALLAIT